MPSALSCQRCSWRRSPTLHDTLEQLFGYPTQLSYAFCHVGSLDGRMRLDGEAESYLIGLPMVLLCGQGFLFAMRPQFFVFPGLEAIARTLVPEEEQGGYRKEEKRSCGPGYLA